MAMGTMTAKQGSTALSSSELLVVQDSGLVHTSGRTAAEVYRTQRITLPVDFDFSMMRLLAPGDMT